MAAGPYQDDRQLVTGVVAGDPTAVSRFLQRAPDRVWSTIAVFLGEGEEAHAAFTFVLEALRANGFSRLERFDGRSSLETFLALATRELLAERTAGAFAREPNHAWRRFEQFFGTDIRRSVRRRFPRADPSRLDDYYQEVCLKLVEDGYRRIRSYNGRGSFTCYILAAVNNILIDLMRREAPRRRLPAEVARQSPLHQAVFIAGAWNGVALDPDSMRLALAGRLQPEPESEELVAVLDQLAGPITAARSAGVRAEEVSIDAGAGQESIPALADPETAESYLIDREDEAAETAFLDRVRRDADRLPAEERLFLQIVLQATDPVPPREIARLMALPVEDVYRLRQKTTRWLRQIAGDAQKSADVSV
jgi:RNA polymerase primary sigma factor